MSKGFHLLPGTKELAKNLLTDAKALVIQVHGTADSAIIAAVFQGLVSLKIAELPGQK
jgi:hypothetical protein